MGIEATCAAPHFDAALMAVSGRSRGIVAIGQGDRGRACFLSTMPWPQGWHAPC